MTAIPYRDRVKVTMCHSAVLRLAAVIRRSETMGQGGGRVFCLEYFRARMR
ncbi:hypothetical protein SRL2020226_61430 [Mycobacterium kiyosense]|nr:hypothetical protein SRL2020226_61430 [Mycobacterium kiyosense]